MLRTVDICTTYSLPRVLYISQSESYIIHLSQYLAVFVESACSKFTDIIIIA